LPVHLSWFGVRAAPHLARGFSWQHGIWHFHFPCRRRVSAVCDPDLPGPRPTHLPPDNHRRGCHTLLRHPIASLLPAGSVAPEGVSLADWVRLVAVWNRYRNINLLSIDYASRPRLRSRLTLGGRTFPRNPWTFGGGDSHSSFATHADTLTHVTSTAGLRRRFARGMTLPYRSRDDESSRHPAASVLNLRPVTFSAQDHSTSELLRTL